MGRLTWSTLRVVDRTPSQVERRPRRVDARRLLHSRGRVADERFAEHLQHPVGRGHEPAGAFAGAAGGAACGDLVTIRLTVDDLRVTDAGFDASGLRRGDRGGQRGRSTSSAARRSSTPRASARPAIERGARRAQRRQAARRRPGLRRAAPGARRGGRGDADAARARAPAARSSRCPAAWTRRSPRCCQRATARRGRRGHARAVARPRERRRGVVLQRRPPSARRARSRTRWASRTSRSTCARAFRAGVVDPWLDEHAEGLTPNPCVRCNGHVRLDAMVDFADRLGAQTLATGHYARQTAGRPPARRRRRRQGPDLHVGRAVAAGRWSACASRSAS